jgi:hypothetical protein
MYNLYVCTRVKVIFRYLYHIYYMNMCIITTILVFIQTQPTPKKRPQIF